MEGEGRADTDGHYTLQSRETSQFVTFAIAFYNGLHWLMNEAGKDLEKRKAKDIMRLLGHPSKASPNAQTDFGL